mgnify:CR=1 FL=1
MADRWLRAVGVVGATALLMVLLLAGCSWRTSAPIPEGVPPPAGDPVPAIDTYAKGRPADQLHDWASARAPALGIPVTALEAYACHASQQSGGRGLPLPQAITRQVLGWQTFHRAWPEAGDGGVQERDLFAGL